jgi:hypothetical protein
MTQRMAQIFTKMIDEEHEDFVLDGITNEDGEYVLDYVGFILANLSALKLFLDTVSPEGVSNDCEDLFSFTQIIQKMILEEAMVHAYEDGIEQQKNESEEGENTNE